MQLNTLALFDSKIYDKWETKCNVAFIAFIADYMKMDGCDVIFQKDNHLFDYISVVWYR